MGESRAESKRKDKRRGDGSSSSQRQKVTPVDDAFSERKSGREATAAAAAAAGRKPSQRNSESAAAELQQPEDRRHASLVFPDVDTDPNLLPTLPTASSSMVDSFIALAGRTTKGTTTSYARGLKWVRNRIAQFGTESTSDACPACWHNSASPTFAAFVQSRFGTPAHRAVVSTAVVVAVFFPLLWRAANISDDFLPLHAAVLAGCLFVQLVDVVVTCLLQVQFFLSFFFVVDTIGSLTVIFNFYGFVNDWKVLLLIAQLGIVRLFRISRLTRVNLSALASLRIRRLVKLLRVDSFTETSTNGVVMGVLAIASFIPLICFETTQNETWFWQAVHSLSGLSSLDCDRQRTAFPVDGDALSVGAEHCKETVEIDILSWFEVVHSHPEFSMEVIWVVVNNVTYLNPNVEYGNGSIPEFDLSSILPARSSNIRTLELDHPHSVSVLLDLTQLDQVHALLGVGQMTLMMVAVFIMAMFVRRSTIRFIVLPLAKLLHALDRAFPGTFPDSEGEAATTRLMSKQESSLTARRQIRDVVKDFILKLIRIMNIQRASLTMADAHALKSNVDLATRNFLEQQFMTSIGEASRDLTIIEDLDGQGVGSLRRCSTDMLGEDTAGSEFDEGIRRIVECFHVGDERTARDAHGQSQNIKPSGGVGSSAALITRKLTRGNSVGVQGGFGTLGFCVLNYSIDDLIEHVVAMLEPEECQDILGPDGKVCLEVRFSFRGGSPDRLARTWAFVKAVAKGYFDNPYHNFRHGVDVMQMMACMLNRLMVGHVAGVTVFQTRLALIAALGHDIGHTGRTNNFLVAMRNELAITYNDVSVQEHMHASKLLQLLSDPRLDILDGAMNPESKRRQPARKLIVELILKTDMAHHMEMVGDAKQLLSVIESQAQEYSNPGTQAGSAGASFTGRRRSSLSAGPCAVGFPTRILALLLHSCDLSTPVRPFETFLGFSKLVVAEFFAQGDEERTLGMEVSPLFDRHQTSMSSGQVGFIDFVVAPLYFTLHRMFPAPLDPFIRNMIRNRFHFRFSRWVEVLQGADSHQQDLMLKEACRNNLEFAEKAAISKEWSDEAMSVVLRKYTAKN